MGILEIVKRAGVGAVGASNPVEILFGTVSKVSPMEIEVHAKLKLTKEFLMLTETPSKTPYKKGDKVVMLRVQGGQKFVVLDRVVDA